MNFSKKILLGLSLTAALALHSNANNIATTNEASFIESYANIALENYTQALNDAKLLEKAI